MSCLDRSVGRDGAVACGEPLRAGAAHAAPSHRTV